MRLWQTLLLSMSSGLLLAASFPKWSQPWLAWVALAPLALALARTPRVAPAFGTGFAAGLAFNLAAISWIPGVLVRYGNLPLALAWLLHALLIGMLACYPGLACAATRLVMNRSGTRSGLLLLPFAWVAVELLRNYSPFGGFPWLLAGYSQTECARILQIADVTGVYGVSFLLLWFNTALAWSIIERGRRLWPLAGAILLVIACLAYGTFSLERWGRMAPTRTAALLQGNISADDPPEVQERKFKEDYVRLASELTAARVDLLVLPESPTPTSFQYDARYRAAMRELAGRTLLGLVFSNIASGEIGGSSSYFNSAYFLSRSGEVLARYDKMHLVPFGEFIPWKSFLFFAESLTREVSDFSPGRDYIQAEIEGRRLSAIICFEAVFPEISRGFARKGSQLLINLTNDAWFGDSAAPHQHLAMSRWRAVENRRFVLRAANSGISAVIDPAGRILAATGLFREEACLGAFDFIPTLSWYTRRGDVCALACVIICILAVAWCFAKGVVSSEVRTCWTNCVKRLLK